MHKRILLKLSGEILMGQYDYGIDSQILERISQELNDLHQSGMQIVVEIGGGNIYRWKNAQPGIKRNTADMMGMLGSVMNAVNLRDTINEKGKAKALSPINIPYAVEYYNPEKSLEYLEKNIVIIGGGVGTQYFTTDTGAVLHALQNNCEVILKGTDVDGVYNDDPDKNKDAQKYDQLNFDEAISKKLGVMDMSAFSLAQENNLPIVVFNVKEKGNITKAAKGENIGTKVQN